MAQTEPTTVDAAPSPPSRSVPSTFSTLSDLYHAWLPTFVTQVVALATNVYNNAVDCYNNAVAAASSAAAALASESSAASNAAAAASSSAAAPFSAGTYNAGVSARSNVNYRIYTARTTGAKATDPSADPTNWALASVGDLPDVPYAGTTAACSLGERSRFTNAAAVAATVPLPTVAGARWSGLWENGRSDNSYDIGAATLLHNGVTLSGVITHNKRMPINLVAVGANSWRFI
jgi:hypothetical protein